LASPSKEVPKDQVADEKDTSSSESLALSSS
jgi:hypothetical protein